CISNWTNSLRLFCSLCRNESEGSTSISMDTIQSINIQNFLPSTLIISIPMFSSMTPNRSTTAQHNRSTTTPATTTPVRSTTTPVKSTTTPMKSTTTPARSTARLTITPGLTLATAPISSLSIAATSLTLSASPTFSIALGIRKKLKIFKELMNELMTPCEDDEICLSVSSSNEEEASTS
ncbi:12556_t:CDS:2, partial [Dentiscutata erythropus]